MIYVKSGNAKYFYYLFAILLSLVIANISVAGDSSTLHRFKPGDVLSSDVINEILNKIDNVTYGFKESDDLVGTWECKTVSSHSNCIGSGLYTDHESGLYAYLIQDITFAENPDHTYSYSTSKAHMFDCVLADWNLPATEGYAVVEGTLILGDPLSTVTHLLNMRKISNSKIILDVVNSLPRSHMVICEKKNLPPDIPTDLDFNLSENIVTLSWTDASNNETGFKILRKDFLDDEYREIGNVNQNTTTYTHTVEPNGAYWYRVKATNGYGESLGSNVVKVTINQ